MKFLLMALVLVASAQVMAFDAEKEFKTNCATCHTIGGGDAGKVGPDLAEVGKRRDLKWIVKFVKYPEGMINGDAEEEGYEKPDAMAKKVYELYKPTVMADQELDETKVKALLKYIDAQGKKPQGKILKALK